MSTSTIVVFATVFIIFAYAAPSNMEEKEPLLAIESNRVNRAIAPSPTQASNTVVDSGASSLIQALALIQSQAQKAGIGLNLNPAEAGKLPPGDDIQTQILKLKEQAGLYQMINDMLKAETMVQAQPYTVEQDKIQDDKTQIVTPSTSTTTTTTMAAATTTTVAPSSHRQRQRNIHRHHVPLPVHHDEHQDDEEHHDHRQDDDEDHESDHHFQHQYHSHKIQSPVPKSRSQQYGRQMYNNNDYHQQQYNH